MGEQLMQPGALHIVNFGQRQPALENLLHLQFTERLPLGVEQYFLALLAAAAHQQHFHRQILR